MFQSSRHPSGSSRIIRPMSPERARTVANVLLFAGAAAAAYVILSRPRLRRAVWRLSRPYLSQVEAYLRREIGDAGMQSGRTS
jgi:hypothetical protein